MLKKSAIAVLAAVVVASAAAPALASYDYSFDTVHIDSLNVDKYQLIRNLQAHGVNATDADAWGTYIRAEVKLNDGTEAVRFFTQDTLAPVNLTRTN